MKNVIKVKHRGSFKNTEHFFNRSLRRDYLKVLEKYGQLGVDILKIVTPSDTGETAEAWSYRVTEGDGVVSLGFYNSNDSDGVNVAILIIYGHGLRNGGFVQGNDFVSPNIMPVFNELANKAWREVTK